MSNEIIIDSSSARTMEQLTEKEQEKVRKKLEKLDYKDPVALIKFGSEHSKEVTDISSQMISKFKVKDFEEAQELITGLIGDLTTVDTDSLLETKKSWVQRLPFIGKKAQSKITNLLTQQMSIERAVDEVEDKMVAAKMSLMGDMQFCKEMVDKTYQYAKNLEIVYITIQEAIKMANQEKAEIEELFNKSPNNLEYSQRLAEINRGIKRLELKAYNTLLFRASTLQSVTQIGMVQQEDELMVQKIDDTIINVIPLWKRNFAIALTIYRLNNAVTIEGIVNDATNKFIKENSEMLKETMLRTAEEMERPSIDPESIKVVYQNLADTFRGMEAVSKQQKEIRDKAIKTIESIQTLSLEMNSGSKLEVKE